MFSRNGAVKNLLLTCSDDPGSKNWARDIARQKHNRAELLIRLSSEQRKTGKIITARFAAFVAVLDWCGSKVSLASLMGCNLS